MSKINFPQHFFICGPDGSVATILDYLFFCGRLHLTPPLTMSLTILIAQVSNLVEWSKTAF